MRPAVRMALAAATTLVLSAPLAAVAAPRPDPGSGRDGGGVPTQQQVEKAQRKVDRTKLSVEQIQGRLVAAQTQVDAAAQEAESAFEAYNGARWRLQQAKIELGRARAASTQAAADVTAQRAGIVTLVTESYQNGTELNAATALMSDEGPQGLMNRYAVVQSAGDSMQAAYERFEIASAKAKRYAGRAEDAEAEQKSLAADAKSLALDASEAAAQAGAIANQIASQKAVLVEQLAKAENISVDLAKSRTAALERVAAQKKAEAAQAEAAAQAQLQAQAAKAAADAKKAKKNQPKKSTDSEDGDAVVVAPVTGVPTPVINPAPNQSVAVQRTIAYARAQIGKPYLWAAAGPSRFDCSGLTMMAWAQGGTSLPHYSVAQFEQSTPIRMVDARPGDLLFWSNNGTPGGIHHVALYIGGGQFIEAPRTGLNVRYNSIYIWYPDFVARP